MIKRRLDRFLSSDGSSVDESFLEKEKMQLRSFAGINPEISFNNNL
jgi:hypothetical protein